MTGKLGDAATLAQEWFATCLEAGMQVQLVQASCLSRLRLHKQKCSCYGCMCSALLLEGAT